MKSLTVISKPADLLKCDTIAKQCREHGKESVIELMFKNVLTTAKGLGINIDLEQATILASDIIEVYVYDSVEDCLAVLKNARQGKYSFGHETRRTITMQHFAEWMGQHLEKKAVAREHAVNKQQNNVPDKYPAIDYDKYNARKAEEKEAKVGRNKAAELKRLEQEEYRKFKEAYDKKA